MAPKKGKEISGGKYFFSPSHGIRMREKEVLFLVSWKRGKSQKRGYESPLCRLWAKKSFAKNAA